MEHVNEVEPTVVTIRNNQMPTHRLLAFGVGHFHNDMCASMWFTYLLIFTTRILGLSSSKAGNLLLIGQIVDAVCTPLIGVESDRVDVHRRCLQYGRRKTWHLLGTLFVVISFVFLFVECFGCVYHVTSEWSQLIYYIPFVIIFQFGWACVQISHLALIPELSACQHERSTLNGIRYAFTVIGNMVVFVLVYIFIGLVDAGQHEVTKNDAMSFTYVAIFVTGIGLLFSIFFHIWTKEKPIPLTTLVQTDDQGQPSNGRDNRSSEATSNQVVQASIDFLDDSLSSNKRNLLTWKEWFKLLDFYLLAILYMTTRIFANITQAYLPLYILETQHFPKNYIALIPLVVYTSSFITSIFLSFKCISRYIPRKIIFLFGILLGIASSVWMWFHELHRLVYGVSVLLGISSTILSIVSLSLIADFINQNTESGAFVYGSMSFVDKIGTGIAIQIVQSLQPDCVLIPCIGQDFYFRGVMVFIPAGALVVSFITLCIIWPRNVGDRTVAEAIEEHVRSRTDDERSLLG